MQQNFNLTIKSIASFFLFCLNCWQISKNDIQNEFYEIYILENCKASSIFLLLFLWCGIFFSNISEIESFCDKFVHLNTILVVFIRPKK